MSARLSDYMRRDGRPKKAEGKPSEDKPKSEEKYARGAKLLKEEPAKKASPIRVKPLTGSVQEAKVDKEIQLKIYTQALLLVRDVLERKERQEPVSKEKFAEVVKNIIDQLISDNQMLLGLANREPTDNYLYAHAVNVCILAVKVGTGLGHTKPQLTELGMEALIHDNIGTGKTPSKKYPIDTAQILDKASDIDKVIVDSIRQQHKRISRHGYPEGFKDEEISESAKIIGLMDVYEALIHSQKYGKRYKPDEAMKMIVDLDNPSFKPQIAKVLIALIKEISPYPIGSIVQLNTGETGMVVRINKDFLSRPVVNIGVDTDGNKLTEAKKVNLAEESLLYIKRLLKSS